MILARYIIREHIGPFIFGFAVVMMILLMNFLMQVLGRIIGKGLAPSIIFKFFFLNLAWMIALAVPMAVLIATLMAFGRLSADNEIIAMKSCGVNIYRMIGPILIVATLVAYGLVEFNNRVLPDANHKARLLSSDIYHKKPALQIEPGIFIDDIPNYNMIVEDKESKEVSQKGNLLGPKDDSVTKNDKLIGITIYDRSNSEIQTTIVAKEGYLEYSIPTKSLVMTLFDGEMHSLELKKYEDYRRSVFMKNVSYVHAPEMVLQFSSSDYRGDREMSAQMMLKIVKDNKKNVSTVYEQINRITDASIRRNLSYLNADRLNLPKRVGYIAPPEKQTSGDTLKLINAIERIIRMNKNTMEQIKNEKLTISMYQREINKYMVEVHKKYSIPVACIVFILIGAPLGIMAKKGGLAVGGAFSIGFFLLYWACLIAGEELADRQIISAFLAMWTPNIIVGGFGIYLLFHSAKELTFLKFSYFKTR
jgi:lipopolysaccharide export system permease protein